MSRHRHTAPRPGFALVMALVGIVIIGALVAGGYLSSVQEYRMGRNALVQQRALAAAEYGLDTVYADWKKAWNSMTSGTTKQFVFNASDNSWTDSVRITKLNQLSFLVVSIGRAGGQGGQLGSRRRAAMIVRLDLPKYNQPGALVSRGNVLISGNTAIHGTDTTFAGWDCPPAGAAVAGAITPSWSNFSFNGKNCKGPTYSCISGSPLVDTSSVAADTATYFSYGSMSWTQLVAQADKIVSGTMSNVQPSTNPDGSCKTTDSYNWGDPNRALVGGIGAGPCESYFPIIYSSGNLAVNGKVGQGLLLVNGDLNIQGNFNFFGQIITRGTVKLTGTGNHVNGGVLAAVIVDSAGSNVTSGNSTIQYSKCALNTVFSSTSYAARAPARSWIELF